MYKRLSTFVELQNIKNSDLLTFLLVKHVEKVERIWIRSKMFPESLNHSRVT